jgi:hypothetical protein
MILPRVDILKISNRIGRVKLDAAKGQACIVLTDPGAASPLLELLAKLLAHECRCD